MNPIDSPRLRIWRQHSKGCGHNLKILLTSSANSHILLKGRSAKCFCFVFVLCFSSLAFSNLKTTFFCLSIAFSPKDRSSQRSTTRFVHAGHVGPVSPQLLLPGIQADRTHEGKTLLFVRFENEEKTARFQKEKRIQTILAFYANQILRDLSYFYIILSYSSRMFYHVSFISQSEGC